MERESMEYDVVIVGAGPSGLTAAIRLMQLAAEKEQEITVCVLEKGSAVGSHILSGAVFEPRTLNELIPDWKEKGAPLDVPATDDNFVMLLNSTTAVPMPTPPQMYNHGNFIISEANFTRWLATQAEELGVEIYPGFPAAQVIYNDDGSVGGVITVDKGFDKNWQPTDNFEPGMELRAKYTMFAEGCRGSLTRTLEEKFKLRENMDPDIYGKTQADPQTYGVGVKEIWEIKPEKHKQGTIMHTVGWPLDAGTYGGSFIYHIENNQVAVGFVVGLDYSNPHISPFDEFQRFKTHPKIRPLFEGGKRVSYGARALNEGGWQSIPKLTFPGGMLIGCSAGFLNTPKIKGIHTAMKSAMVAAEETFEALVQGGTTKELVSYPRKLLKESWLGQELYVARNVRPSFQWGMWAALAYAGLDTYVFRGKAPWTLHFKHADNQTLKKASEAPKIDYPKPDGVISFDKLSSVYLSNTHHGEHQPAHLTLKDPAIPISYNLALYDAPEQRYCPAGVYEIVTDDDGSNPSMQINFSNCVHCKTCDIKDPKQNIVWVTPEGGDGPEYPNM
ncbi:MAG: electron transfer flavoprotein-ubiquinone oxidoreductase [Gammaproteobacteria bacterium]|nr:electron transfer flavoprotein-ubiquinone oxidoreductase [Gammaproteobacteria bacterium]MCP5459977.1 electron transfer flavoprotein-ubiquinone oxidoreductase [Gammaproteobacteria bacterium]